MLVVGRKGKERMVEGGLLKDIREGLLKERRVVIVVPVHLYPLYSLFERGGGGGGEGCGTLFASIFEG